MKKPVTLLLATLLLPLSGALFAAEAVTMDGKQYNTIEVNGKTYLTPDNGNKKRATRSLESEQTQRPLYQGDVLLQGPDSPKLTVSGTLLVKVDDARVRELASRHGLSFKQRSGSIALLEAKQGDDLNAVATALRQEGVSVQIELAGKLMQPK